MSLYEARVRAQEFVSGSYSEQAEAVLRLLAEIKVLTAKQICWFAGIRPTTVRKYTRKRLLARVGVGQDEVIHLGFPHDDPRDLAPYILGPVGREAVGLLMGETPSMYDRFARDAVAYDLVAHEVGQRIAEVGEAFADSPCIAHWYGRERLRVKGPAQTHHVDAPLLMEFRRRDGTIKTSMIVEVLDPAIKTYVPMINGYYYVHNTTGYSDAWDFTGAKGFRFPKIIAIYFHDWQAVRFENAYREVSEGTYRGRYACRFLLKSWAEICSGKLGGSGTDEDWSWKDVGEASSQPLFYLDSTQRDLGMH